MSIIKHVQNFTNYNHEVSEKKHICLHTTAGHGINNVVNWWKTRNDGKGTISTPYIIARNGDIYQIYSPQYWSHHTGKGATIDKQTIGIEIENAGIGQINDKYEIYNDIGVRIKEYISWIDEKETQWYHEEITQQQWKSIIYLVNQLCSIYRINPKLYIGESFDINNTQYGIFTHKQINSNKSDIPIEMFEDANRHIINIPFL